MGFGGERVEGRRAQLPHILGHFKGVESPLKDQIPLKGRCLAIFSLISGQVHSPKWGEELEVVEMVVMMVVVVVVIGWWW